MGDDLLLILFWRR